MIQKKDNSRQTKENSKPREARAAKTEKPRRGEGSQAGAKRGEAPARKPYDTKEPRRGDRKPMRSTRPVGKKTAAPHKTGNGSFLSRFYTLGGNDRADSSQSL